MAPWMVLLKILVQDTSDSLSCDNWRTNSYLDPVNSSSSFLAALLRVFKLSEVISVQRLSTKWIKPDIMSTTVNLLLYSFT